jgi:hypothetical protein
MKRLVCTLTLLAMLIWTCTPAHAEYQGELLRDLAWQINVDNSEAGGKTAVTVHYLSGRSGEKEISRNEIEIGLVAAGARTQLVFSTLGKGISRIIVEVDAPLNTHITVNVSQAASYPADIVGYGRLVFNVVD